MSETLAPAPLPTPPQAPGTQPRAEAGGPERPPMGGSWEEPRENGVGGGGMRGMTAARTPAGRGGPARPARAAAERAGPALQKAAAGWPGRSHPAAGAGGAAALPPAPGLRPAARPPGTAPCPETDYAARPSSGGPRSPAARSRYASACPLPAARSALPAAPGPRRDGVGPAPPRRAMGRPLGTEQPPEA